MRSRNDCAPGASLGAMVVALSAFAALFVCVLAGFSAWSATLAVRLGKFSNRDGIEISRRENSIFFGSTSWLGFSL